MQTDDIKEKINIQMKFNEEIIEENAPPEFHVLLSQYIHDKKMTKVDVIRKLNIDRNYGYMLLNGKRAPTRNCIIQIALLLGLEADRLDYLLKLAGKAPLYVRNVIDAKVYYAMTHNMNYYDAVNFIWDGTA